MRVSGAGVVTAAFVVETLLAGGNGVAIRFSNRELAPLWGAALRFLSAALLMVCLMAAARLPVPRGRAFLGAMAFGLLQFAGAFGFYYVALVEIHAGLGQTLLALVPLATLILAVAQRMERVRRAAIGGTILSLVGIGLIYFDPRRGAIAPLSIVLVLGSVLCFAQALVVVRRFPQVHPITLNGVGMLTGALVLLGASMLLGEPRALPHTDDTWFALGYAVVFGSVLVFLLHVFVAQKWSASRAAYVMVTIPLVTIGLSAWLDGEPITMGLVFGGLLVLGGVYVGALRRAGTPPQAIGPYETVRG